MAGGGGAEAGGMSFPDHLCSLTHNWDCAHANTLVTASN